MVKYYCCLDLEATCGKTVSKNNSEIIEIGAVMIDGKTFEQTKEFQSFVQPVIHPTLDWFCKELTHITQEQVDSALGFVEVLKKFIEWIGDKHDVMFSSWGDYDRKQFYRDCQLHNVFYPFSKKHLNIKQLFSAKLGEKNRFSVTKALIRQQMKFEGSPHRGIDDAINIARIFRSISGENGINTIIIDVDIAKVHKYQVSWRNSSVNVTHSIMRDLTEDEAIALARFISELKGWMITNRMEDKNEPKLDV